MDKERISPIFNLMLVGCLIFDFALILAFLKIFGSFFIVSFSKSLCAMLVLLLGLVASNVAVVAPNIQSKNVNLPFSNAISVLLILYACIANAASVFLLTGSIVRYIVWQLIVLAIFLILLSVTMAYLKRGITEVANVEKEQMQVKILKLQVLRIDNLFTEKMGDPNILSVLPLFTSLRERALASTPFGRIVGNNEVAEIEEQVMKNFLELEDMLSGDFADNRLIEVRNLLEETKRLIINREALNIK